MIDSKLKIAVFDLISKKKKKREIIDTLSHRGYSNDEIEQVYLHLIGKINQAKPKPSFNYIAILIIIFVFILIVPFIIPFFWLVTVLDKKTLMIAGSTFLGFILLGIIFIFLVKRFTQKKIIGWGFIIISIPILLVFISSILTGFASESWQPADAKIIRSEIVESHSKGKTLYAPLLEYEYKVNDIRYTGTRIEAYSQIKSSLKGYSKGIIEKYPINSTITIFYNPADPKESLIDKGALKVASLFILLPITFLMIGIKLVVPELG